MNVCSPMPDIGLVCGGRNYLIGDYSFPFTQRQNIEKLKIKVPDYNLDRTRI